MIIANMKFTMTINCRTLCCDTNDQYRFESCISAAQIKRTSGERTEKKDRVEGKRSLLKYKNNLKFTLKPTRNSPAELAHHKGGTTTNQETNISRSIFKFAYENRCAKLFASTHRVGECFGEKQKVRAAIRTAPKAADDVGTLLKI
jgi:hypothetical protein